MDEREQVQLKVRKSTHDYFRDMAAETGLPKSSLMGACLDAAARNGWRFAIVRTDGGSWREGGQEGDCGGDRGSGVAGPRGIGVREERARCALDETARMEEEETAPDINQDEVSCRTCGNMGNARLCAHGGMRVCENWSKKADIYTDDWPTWQEMLEARGAEYHRD